MGLFFLLSFFAYSVTAKAFAQEETLEIAETPTPPVASSSPKIKYDLAYPGILPDNPLYKIKVLRDKITEMLVSDHFKKVDFYLLQADKGILATAMLVDKNNIALAEQTALKAEHNFTQISRTIGLYYRENQKPTKKSETRDLVSKLKTASSKHQEVLTSLLKRVPRDNQKTFENVIYFSKSNMKK